MVDRRRRPASRSASGPSWRSRPRPTRRRRRRRVVVSAQQLRINQKISQAAVKRVNDGRRGTSRRSGAAAPLYAVSSGASARTSCAAAAPSPRSGSTSGNYRVKFTRNIAACSWSATPATDAPPVPDVVLGPAGARHDRRRPAPSSSCGRAAPTASSSTAGSTCRCSADAAALVGRRRGRRGGGPGRRRGGRCGDRRRVGPVGLPRLGRAAPHQPAHLPGRRAPQQPGPRPARPDHAPAEDPQQGPGLAHPGPARRRHHEREDRQRQRVRGRPRRRPSPGGCRPGPSSAPTATLARSSGGITSRAPGRGLLPR